MKLTTILLTIAGALGLAATPASASHGHDLIEQSHRIESIVGSLRKEFSIHYRHSRGYRHLQKDLSNIHAKSEHIHHLAHDPVASLGHISQDLRQLDASAHHLHEVVDAIEDGAYGGHVDGDTRHVHSLLSSLNRSIHSMQATARAIEASRHHRRGYHDDHRGHRERDYGRRRPPHPAEIFGSIFRRLHGS